MFEMIIRVFLLYVMFWVFVIAIGLIIVVCIIRLIMNAVANSKRKKEYENSEPGSIGDLVARSNDDLRKGNIDALIDSSADRYDALKILEWFNRKVKNGEYQAIRETEAKGSEPNYAFMIRNDSGYDFKEFSCKAIVYTSAKALPAVNCTAKDWKQGNDGLLWFYCASNDIKRMTMDAKDIKYTIDPSTVSRSDWDPDSYEPDFSEPDEMDSDDYDMDPYDDYDKPYICPECFEPYDGTYCECCGHYNDIPGYEEVSEDERFAEDFVAAMLIGEEERKKEKQW